MSVEKNISGRLSSRTLKYLNRVFICKEGAAGQGIGSKLLQQRLEARGLSFAFVNTYQFQAQIFIKGSYKEVFALQDYPTLGKILLPKEFVTSEIIKWKGIDQISMEVD